MAFLAALAAALCYAAGAVLQQHVAESAPTEHWMRPQLLLHLARHPRWLLGVAGDGGAYFFEVIALSLGGLIFVQPLLVSGLMFALPMAHVVSDQKMRQRDWVGAVTLVAGLLLFLVVAAPKEGRFNPPAVTWLVTAGATLIPAAVFVLLALGPWDTRRPELLGAAGGITFGFTTALTRTSAELFHEGLGTMLTSWQPYALVACGLITLLLAQSAFQAGPLAASLPAITVSDQISTVTIGWLAFQEPIRSDPLAIVLEVVGMAAMVVGIFILSRSPLVVGAASRRRLQRRAEKAEASVADPE